MAAPAAAATSGPPGDVLTASSGATEKKGMAEDGVTYTRYAGEADNRGASMVAKHHEIMQARKEKADLERLSRLVPDLCEPVLVIALQENNYDVPDAQGLLRDFRHDCQERLAQLQRKRKRVRQGRVDLSKPKPEAKGAGTAEKADDGSGSGSDSESGSGSDSGSDSDSDEEEGIRGQKDRAEVERKTGENGETEAGRREATLDQPVQEASGRRGRGEGSEASDDDRSREKEARPSRGGGDAEAEAAREGKSGSERSREEKEREKERGRKKRREREKERSSKRRGKEREQERAGRRRRKAKEKEREKERERKKRRKDKESKAKGGKSETETAAEILGRFGVIRETDYGAKKPEFIQWALEVRKQDTELMSRFEERAMFMEYLQDYNTQKLPHEKYYNLEAWEKKRHLKAMQRAAEGKTGADPADELPMFDDEKVRQRELREQRIKEAQERMAAAYDELRTSGKAQEMREQEMLRMQMNLHYRTGNLEQARELQERLGPDDSNPYKKKHASIRELR